MRPIRVPSTRGEQAVSRAQLTLSPVGGEQIWSRYEAAFIGPFGPRAQAMIVVQALDVVQASDLLYISHHTSHTEEHENQADSVHDSEHTVSRTVV